MENKKFDAKKFFGKTLPIIPDNLSGKVIVITGSNTGIGKETARVLAFFDAIVILACRDAGRTLPVVEELKKETGNEKIEFIKCDLSDLSSIREFATDFQRKYERLDILINNAGIVTPDRRLTKDGFEMQFGTNHLGHFYLTSLLIEQLKRAAPSRVINISSRASASAKMNWADLMFENKYSVLDVYSQSKLANIIFSKELQRRLEDFNVKVVSLHPGVIVTELTRHVGEKGLMKALLAVSKPFMHLFGKSIPEGAKTTLYCALEEHEKLVAGGYYTDCKVVKENPIALVEDNWSKLWEMSEQLIAPKVAN